MADTNDDLVAALKVAKAAREEYGRTDNPGDCEEATTALFDLDLGALIAALQPPALKLFYIQCECGGENYDLFVWAETALKAEEHFVAYYDLDMEDATNPDNYKTKIRALPTAAPDKAGAIGWDILNATMES
jgi:hypothetical protein